MQKYASKTSYQIVFEPLPIQNEKILYCDEREVDLPYAEDFPKLHYHDRYELGICTQGGGLFLCEGTFYSVSKGDLLFIPVGHCHYSRSLDENAPCKCRFIYVNQSAVDSVLGGEGNGEEILRDSTIPTVISGSKYPRVAALFSEINELCDEKSNSRDKRVVLRLATFLLDAQSVFPSAMKIASSSIAIKKEPDSAAERTALFLALHYSESQSAAELARLAHISASQLRRQFLASYGMPPIAYRNYLRACIGAELLTCTRQSVSEIAVQVGYSSASDFYRVFLKQYGVSPSEYRRKGHS